MDTKRHITREWGMLDTEQEESFCGIRNWQRAIEFAPESYAFRSCVWSPSKNDCEICFRVAQKILTGLNKAAKKVLART